MPKRKYDEGYKKLFKNKSSFIHFLQKYIGEPWTHRLTTNNLKLCNSEFIMGNYRKRTSDAVWKLFLPDHNIPIYIIQELQSRPDPTMAYRTLVYTMNMLISIFESTEKKKRKKTSFQLPVVISIVFYNGSRKWNASTCFSDYQKGFELFRDHAANFQYYFVNLNALDDSFIQNSNTLLDNIFAVDKLHNEENWIFKLEDISTRVKKLAYNEQKEFWNWVHKVLATSIYDKEKIEEIITILQEQEGSGMVSALEIILKREFKKHRKEGLKQGRLEGRLEAFAKTEETHLQLFQHLKEANQIDLFPTALQNPELKNELLAKFHIE